MNFTLQHLRNISICWQYLSILENDYEKQIYCVCTFSKVLQWQAWKCKTISTWKLRMENLNCENKIFFHCSKMLAITIKIKFTGNDIRSKLNRTKIYIIKFRYCNVPHSQKPSAIWTIFDVFQISLSFNNWRSSHLLFSVITVLIQSI